MARYLITLDSGVHTDSTAAQTAITGTGASVVKSYSFSLTFEIEATAEQLAAISGVIDSIEKNTVTSVTVQAVNQAHLTHLAVVSQGPGSLYAPSNTGAGGHVYLVDTGIYSDHEQFVGRNINNLYTNFGTDFADTVGHGTAVGSVIIGNTQGVAKDATLHNVKLFNSATGDITIGEIIDALDAVLTHHNANDSSKVKVVCLPWVTAQNNFIDNKITEMNASNLIVVAAAGNNGDDVNNYSPAGVNSVITVGAYDADFNVTAFTNVPWTDPTSTYYTNYGAALDIFTLGVDISHASISAVDGYSTSSGTSMASGIVAGVAVQWALNYASKTSAEIKDIILQEGHITGSAKLQFDPNLPIASADVYRSVATVTLTNEAIISNLPSGRLINVQLGQQTTKDLELNLAGASNFAVISFAPLAPWMALDLTTGILSIDTSNIDPTLVPGVYLFGIRGNVGDKVIVEEYSVGLYNINESELEEAPQYYFDEDTNSYDQVVNYQVAPSSSQTFSQKN